MELWPSASDSVAAHTRACSVQETQASATAAGNSGKLQTEHKVNVPPIAVHDGSEGRSNQSNVIVSEEQDEWTGNAGHEQADDTGLTRGVSIKPLDRRASAALPKGSYRGSPVTDVRLATEINHTTVTALQSIGPSDFQAVREIGQGAFGKVRASGALAFKCRAEKCSGPAGNIAMTADAQTCLAEG